MRGIPMFWLRSFRCCGRFVPRAIIGLEGARHMRESHGQQRRAVVEELEDRRLLSAGSVVTASSSAAVGGAVVSSGVKRTAAPTLSLADRQELLANWVASDAATL